MENKQRSDENSTRSNKQRRVEDLAGSDESPERRKIRRKTEGDDEATQATNVGSRSSLGSSAPREQDEEGAPRTSRPVSGRKLVGGKVGARTPGEMAPPTPGELRHAKSDGESCQEKVANNRLPMPLPPAISRAAAAVEATAFDAAERRSDGGAIISSRTRRPAEDGGEGVPMMKRLRAKTSQAHATRVAPK